MNGFHCAYSGEYDPTTVETLCGALSIQPLTARALIRRGLTEASDAERFLHPEELELSDPFAMPNMRAALERLRKAFTEDENICVYGDYDADGVCATAILLDCFSVYSERVQAYIPSRHSEGYGLHEEAVRKLHARGVNLIVTVDNGISALEEVALCTSLGMDVIVTDHHSRPERLPDCSAVVVPEDGACGAGVALRLARALCGDTRLSRWLPLAAVATVADVVPLTGDNRAVVARGIPWIEDNLGLNALLHAAGNGDNAVDASTLAFLLAPRLNAAGRLGDAMRGVSLLTTEDRHAAETLAAELDGVNAKRRSIEAEIYAEAEGMLSLEDEGVRRAILLSSTGWNVGVIGIVASRMSERHHCPVILFSDAGDGILSGSGRSAGRIDLYAALSACSKHFMRFGGHKGAAGITMAREAFETFSADFREFLRLHYDASDFVLAKDYDERLCLSELTLSAVAELKCLAPFGEGNPEPVYRIDGVRLSELRGIGHDGSHISARAGDGSASLRLVGFGFGERLEEFKTNADDSLSILVRPSIHTYRGMESVELVLTAAETSQKLFDDFFMNVLYNSFCMENLDFPYASDGGAARFDGDSMRRMYLQLRKCVGTGGCRVEELLARFDRPALCALLVFLELGFFSCHEALVTLSPGVQKRALTDSRLYRRLQSKDEREDSSWI